VRQYYIWWDRGRLTITRDKPVGAEYTVTYQSDVTVKNWQNSIDWYEQVQAILLSLWDNDHLDDVGLWWDEGGR
jgi:hypothetical protein